MVYQYSVFGFVVSSPIPLPELVPASNPVGADKADINIALGTVPQTLDKAIIQTPGYMASEDTSLVALESTARCMATQGCTLTVEPAPVVDELSLRTFILNSGLVALLQQRLGMVLQASAIRWGNAAVLIVAASSAGKSTLAAQFSELGHLIVTDETAFLTLDAMGRLVVHPGYPALKLWPDMLAQLKPSWTQPNALRPGLDKTIMLVPERFWHDPLPVAGMFFFRSASEPEVRIIPVKGRDRFAFLAAASSRLAGCKSLDQKKTQFAMTGLISNLAVYHQIVRPIHLAYCENVIKESMRFLTEKLPI